MVINRPYKLEKHDFKKTFVKQLDHVSKKPLFFFEAVIGS